MSYCDYLLEEYFGISEGRYTAGRSSNKYGVVYSKSNGDPRHSGKGFCGLGDRHDNNIKAKSLHRFGLDHGTTKKDYSAENRYLRAHLGKASIAKDDLKLDEGGNAENKENKKDWEKITRPDGTETNYRQISKLSDHNDRINYWTDQGVGRLKDIQAKSYLPKVKSLLAKRAMRANLMSVPKGGWDLDMRPK